MNVWEREPHCYRCTSPQLIALCVVVSPLYSTPDKMCVSVHDACNDKQLNKVRWACMLASCVSCYILCYIYFTESLTKLQKFGFGLKSSNRPWDFGEQYCSAWCTWLCTNNRSHTPTFTSGPQNTSTVAMQTMTSEIWYQILNGFYRNSVYN